MSILLRGLAIFRPLSISRLFAVQDNRPFLFPLRRESSSLRYTNTSYPFALSPQTELEPDPTGLSQTPFLEGPSDEYGTLEESEVQDEGALPNSSSEHAMYLLLRLLAKGEVNRALAARDEYIKIGRAHV